MSSQPVTFTPASGPAGSDGNPNTAAYQDAGVQQSVTTSDDERPLTRKEFRELMEKERLKQLQFRQKLEGRAKKAAANEAERLRGEGVSVSPDQEKQLYNVALNALDQDVEVVIKPKQKQTGHVEVRVVAA